MNATIRPESWESLSAALAREPRDIGFLGARMTPERLAAQHAAGLGFVITDDAGNIIASTFLWDTPVPGWYEVGTVWASPAHRGQGLGARVFRDCIAAQRQQGISAFVMTHNPRVVHLAESSGWVEATADTWELHVPWQSSCAVCDRVANPGLCPMRAKPDCRMLVAPP